MLTAPTPLFSPPICSTILVEPLFDPVETGASFSEMTPIQYQPGDLSLDLPQEASGAAG
jgi:hypothetical protein